LGWPIGADGTIGGLRNGDPSVVSGLAVDDPARLDVARYAITAPGTPNYVITPQRRHAHGDAGAPPATHGCHRPGTGSDSD